MTAPNKVPPAKAALLLSSDDFWREGLTKILSGLHFDCYAIDEVTLLQQKTFDLKPTVLAIDSSTPDFKLPSFLKLLQLLPSTRRPYVFIRLGATESEADISLTENLRELVSEFIPYHLPFAEIQKVIRDKSTKHSSGAATIVSTAANVRAVESPEELELTFTNLVDFLSEALQIQTFFQLLSHTTHQAMKITGAVNIQVVFMGKQHESKGVVLSATQPQSFPGIEFNLEHHSDLTAAHRSQKTLIVNNVDVEVRLRHFKTLADQKAFYSLVNIPIKRRGIPFAIMSCRFEQPDVKESDDRIVQAHFFAKLLELRLAQGIEVTPAMVAAKIVSS